MQIHSQMLLFGRCYKKQITSFQSGNSIIIYLYDDVRINELDMQTIPLEMINLKSIILNYYFLFFIIIKILAKVD